MARRKALAWLCVGLAFGALACGNEGSETPPPPESTPAPVTGPELEPSEADRPPADPPALRAAQRRGVQRKAGPAYRVRASDTARAFEASNPQHAFVARFSEDGVALEGRARDAGEGAGGYRAVLTLERAGCGAAARRVGVAVPQAVEAQGNRIEYRRDASELVEWYENGPLGLEQGFTLAGPRLCEGATGALELELAVRGDLEPRRRDAGELLLVDGDGGARLRVHALHAEDATGRVLPAELAVRGERIALRVDVAGATYPVQIDPLIGVEQTKLLARDASYFEMGERVAVTTGSTAVVGVRSDDTQGSLSGTAYVFVRSGSAWAEQAKFRPSSGTPSEYFGSDVAAQGEDALVGSYGYAASQGAAYVYVRSGTSWSQQALLTASDGAASDWFGYALSLDSSVALVGAYGDDDNGSTSGSAYVFTRSGTTWSQQAKLVASDGAAGDYFGRAVALAVPYALIGAWGDDDKGTNGGSAYVFYRTGTTWAQQAKLAATDGAASSYFGQAVAASTTSVSIGSYGDATSRGAVYVFDRSGTVWSQVAKVVASDGASGDYFGFSVSAFGSRLAVGAYNDDDEGTSSGAAYTFTRSGTTFTQEAKLVPSDGAASDNFGHSVAHRLNDLIVGVPGLDSRGYSSGAAYAYRLAGSSTWILETKALPHDAYGSDYFGRAVGVRGDTAIVGAYADDTGGSTSGMSWVFKRSGTTWSHQARLFPTDYAASQRNGYSVDVGGTDSAVAVVSAFGDQTYRGAAYVFNRIGVSWSQGAKLVASAPADYDYLAHSVAITSAGTTVVAGAYADDVSVTDQGSVYVYTGSGAIWSSQATLVASDPVTGDFLGYAVDVGDNGSAVTVIAGAYGKDNGFTDSGAAYAFTRSGSTWSQQSKFSPTDRQAGDFFGISVGYDADSAVVGAYGVASYTGAAYVYVRSGTSWSQQAKLTASDGVASDYFGRAVTISGNIVAVGAYGDDDLGSSSGSAYIFKRTGTSWAQQSKVTASDGASGDYFGLALALDATTLVSGAYYNNELAASGGAAYVSLILSANGDTCALATECASGNCVDGVCCDAACGNGVTTDCLSCNQTGLLGVCSFLPSTYTCRASAGECDVPDQCTGSASTCPADAKKSNGTACTDDGNPCSTDTCNGSSNTCQHPAGNAGATCRSVAGVCDRAETCTGSSTTCPTDAFEPTTTSCRSAAGECDQVEYCPGNAAVCPSDTKKASGTACADDGNVCSADTCNGSSNDCQHPAGNAGTVCRTAGGECDLAEACTGSSTTCPADAKKASGTACTNDGNACTVDQCNGSSNTCPYTAAPSSTVCRVAAGACDQAENCTGSSTTCPADSFLGASTVCRSGAGTCDVAENCTGSSAACPADAFVASGSSCRPAAGECDVAETCPGNSASCPSDAKKSNGTACTDDGNACSADSCNGTADTCQHPAGNAGSVCRPAAGECDLQEACTGSSTSCPSDSKRSNGAACTADTNVCTLDQCNGTAVDCQHPAGNAGTVCREANGACDAAEACTGSSTSCPADAFQPSSTVCRSAAGVCDIAENCPGNGTACPADTLRDASYQCGAPSCDSGANEATLASYCTGLATTCPPQQQVSCAPYTCSGAGCGGTCPTVPCLGGYYCDSGVCLAEKANGQSCSTGTQCSSGNCIDGVCCNTTCGSGATTDCQACNVAGSLGTCSNLPSTTTCRGAAGECDQEEKCTGSSSACPSDGKKANGTACTADTSPCTLDQCNGSSNSCQHPAGNAGTECRASTGGCDPAESCTGSSTTCPADALAGAGTECRAAAGACDVAESCTGASAACPADAYAASGTSCRSAAGECDLAETCTGSSTACPSDSKKTSGTSCTDDGNVCTVDQCNGSSSSCQHPAGNAGTVCRGAAGECDVAEACSGTATTCPSDAKKTSGTACTADTNPCTLDQCNGTAVDCQHPAGNAGTTCRSSAGDCDVAETCSGSSTSCPADAFATSATVCRSSVGACDLAETCTGASVTCPADSLAPSGTQCRAAAGECDVAETCSGSTTSCPADTKKSSGTACTADTNPCTLDQCNGSAVDCQHPAGNAGASCRSAAGECDVAETCSGTSTSCPADAKKSSGTACTADTNACTLDQCNGSSNDCQYPAGNAGTICRDTTGECDLPETCSGTATSCPADTKKPSGTVCTADTNPCSEDECDGSSAACQHPAGNAGTTCRVAAGPCDVAETCSGSSTSCPADSLAGSTTVCRPAAGGCDVAETCSGSSTTCPTDLFAAASTSCRSASCAPGTPPIATQGANCTGSDADCPPPQTIQCPSANCNGNICGGCTLDSECVSGLICDTGVCVSPKPDGSTCSAATQCASGVCVDGVCCDDACGGGAPNDCQACNVPGSVGTCAPAPSTVVCRDSAGECDVAETCTGTNTSCPADTKLPSGTACTADGNPCTQDECNGTSAACGYTPGNAGAVCRPSAGTCDVEETCTGTAAACPADAFVPSTTVCREATDACDAEEKCTGSDANCPVDGKAAAGADCQDDGNACTTDRCDGSGGCQHAAGNSGATCRDVAGPCDVAETCDGATLACPADAFKTDGTSCADANVCNGSESCATGVCSATVALNCDDGNACTVDACDPTTGCSSTNRPDGFACDDGNPCNTDDRCTAGVCAGSGGPNCNDNNPCTNDTCDTGTQACINTPATDGTPCNDSSACTQVDSCQAGTCTGSSALNCDDGNACTTDVCDTGIGCLATPVADGGSCTDGNPCNGAETCQAGACSSGTPLVCNDGNPCTADGCSPTGGCITVAVPNGISCSDGNPCNGAETCQAGACAAGSVTACDDANPCTADACDSVTGACTHVPLADGVSCSDGDPCNGAEICQGTVCAGGATVDCDDGDPCTVDSCGGSQGCTHVAAADGTSCEDASACTQGDACLAGVCTAGATIGCDDDNPCTVDICDPSFGCAHASLPDATTCDDGNPCSTGDACAGGACRGTGGVDCDDGDPCTTDSCDTGTQTCTHVARADGAACSDGSACTFGDTCQSGSCAGTAMACGDANECTLDDCDAATGCLHNPQSGSPCNDGNPCTEGDRCVASTCTPLSGTVCAPAGECRASGACDLTTGLCTDPPAPDGTVCSSGACQSGACVSTGGAGGASGAGGAGGQDGGAGASGAAGVDAGGAAGASGAAGTGGAGGGGATTSGGAAGASGAGGTAGSSGASGAGGAGGGAAGTGGGGTADAGPDAATGETFAFEPGGCSCRTTGRDRPLPATLAVLGVLGALAARRRRSAA